MVCRARLPKGHGCGRFSVRDPLCAPMRLLSTLYPDAVATAHRAPLLRAGRPRSLQSLGRSGQLVKCVRIRLAVSRVPQPPAAQYTRPPVGRHT